VHSLRSFQEALALRRELCAGRRLVVIGAGFVGTEVASTASSLGLHVTLVDPNPPLWRVLGDEVSALLQDRYRGHGVDVRRAGVAHVESSRNRIPRGSLDDGAVLDVDALLVAVGAEPAVPGGLARAPGGIQTDECGRTAFDDVYACGDVACTQHPVLRRALRVEHWTDAATQGAAVADAILGREPRPRALPFFWSDQFGLRLQYLGHAPVWSSVELEGDADGFRAVYRDSDGRPLAGLVANRPRELAHLREQLDEALPRAA
jgi:NADPH-dependent 2,4-dienoyl-CoA reductase/sulfur reductase-like enzyme